VDYKGKVEKKMATSRQGLSMQQSRSSTAENKDGKSNTESE
jgi:hypothetical protein